MVEITKDLIIKEAVKKFAHEPNKFMRWKRKAIFPEVLEALMGRSEEHTVIELAPDLIAVKRHGYLYPHFFVDTTQALVYCQFWHHEPKTNKEETHE